MHFIRSIMLLNIFTFSIACSIANADVTGCSYTSKPAISFVETQSLDLALGPNFSVVVKGPLTVKGKLSIPVPQGCYAPKHGLPAVLILHGSNGVDARGDFYAQALNAAGIATLEIDMWEARGVSGVANRPALPVITYPDVFAGLTFLSTQQGIDPARIGVLGFSWGGVLSLISATENVAQQFGGNLRFKAHVANYPVCYVYNNPHMPNSGFGSQASNPLTGAPIMIQISSLDDYDQGTAPCFALKAGLPSDEQALVDVVAYDGVTHAWDRLMVPTSTFDPFGYLGLGGTVKIIPDVDKAYESRRNIVRFFKLKL